MQNFDFNNSVQVKLKAILFCVGMFFGSHAFSYELGAVCKEETNGWYRASGNCDAKGLLQGPGIAIKGTMVFVGNYNNGLPDGMHKIVIAFDEPMRDRTNNKKFILEQAKTISNQIGRLGYESLSRLTCEINFINGLPTGKTIICAGFNIQTNSDIVMEARSDGDSNFIINDATVKGTRAFTKVPFSRSTTGTERDIKFDGTVLNIKFGVLRENILNSGVQRGIYFKNFTGVASKSNEYRLQGVFDLVTRNKSEFEIVLNVVKETGKDVTPVDESLLYDLTINSFSYKFATYYTPSWNGADVYYLKSVADNVEFDASGFPLCIAKYYGSAQAHGDNRGKAFFDPSSNSKANYKLVPTCGKITDKNGRSYSGLFDKDGQPKPN